MSTRQSIDDQWASYRDQILPADAPRVQLTECKRAFFAGALGGLSALGSDPSESPDRALARIQKELADFGKGGGRS